MAAQVAPAAPDAQPRGPPRNVMAAPRGPPGPPRNITVVDREKVRVLNFSSPLVLPFVEFSVGGRSDQLKRLYTSFRVENYEQRGRVDGLLALE